MKTSTIEVGELVSTLSTAGVERQLSTLPGVHHANVNYVAGSATVHYDEGQIALEAIPQRVVECGYHCRGELAPAHVCDPAGHKMAGDSHAGHVMSSAAGAQGTAIESIGKKPVATGFTNIDGQGARANIGSDAVLLGNRNLMVAINALMLKRTKLAGIKRAQSPGAPATAAKLAAGASV